MKSFLSVLAESSGKDQIEFLQIGIKEEQDAIALYTKFMEASTDPKVREVFKHVIDEERHHIEEFEGLLAALQYGEVSSIDLH